VALDFAILGPLEVRSDGALLPLRAAKQRLLLAILLLRANEVVSSDALIDALWGEAPPATATKALQVHVSQLRKVLGPGAAGVLRTSARGYVLAVDDDRLDLVRFTQATAAAAAAADPDEAARHLWGALALWRGDPLAELDGVAGLRGEVARLEELRWHAVEDRIDADLALGRHGAVVAELEALVDRHPGRERLHAQLMLALYRAGRQGDALAVFRAARRALVDELGIEPGRELRELHERILAQDPGLDRAPGPQRTTDDLVGRERELGTLLPILDGALGGGGAVVLLAGEPGIGKSRLAESLARHAFERGAAVAVGRCWEAGGAPAYWPWVQALGALVHEVEPATLTAQLGRDAAEVAAIVPQVAELVPDASPAEASEGDGGRFRLFAAVAAFLRRAAAERPIALLLDDLHVADPPSLVLLRYLAAELPRSRIVIVGCYRDTDVTPATAAALSDLARERSVHRTLLNGCRRRTRRGSSSA
jgi:DNA-binding SARP family transcriptional activator